MRYRVMFGFLILMLVVGVGYAYRLNPTVVTASRITERWFESSSFVDIFTSEELKSMGAKSVGEALQFIPGVVFSANGPAGMDSWVEIRGVKKEVLVMIDGVPVNNPKGSSAKFSFNLSLLPIDDIQRIEVVKGAESSLYGSSAFGGVINIVTKASSNERYVNVAGGTNGYRNYFLRVGGARQKRSWSLSLSRTDSGRVKGFHLYKRNGKLLHDDFIGSSRKTACIKLTSGNCSFLYDYATLSSDYYYRGVYTAANRWMYLYHLCFENSQNKVMFHYHRYDDSYVKKGYSTYSKVTDKGIDIKKVFVLSDNAMLVSGAGWKSEHIDSSTDGVHTRNIGSMYAEYRLNTGSGIWNVGGRYEWVNSDKDYSEFIPHFGVTFKVSKDVNLFFSVGRAFKLPTFNELYMKFYSGSGNPDLRPEYGWTYEVGLKKLFNHGSLAFSLFYNRLSDYINWEKIDSGEYKPLNIQDFRMLGAELSFVCNFDRCWRIDGGVTYEVAEDRGSPKALDPEKWYECGIPRWQASLGISYCVSDFFVAMHYKYVGERRYKDRLYPYVLSGYGVWNLSLKKEVLNSSYFGLEVSNLFDERYELRKDFMGMQREIRLFFVHGL